MNKLPRKTKQWADEAFRSLDVAWGLLKEERPNPDENEKLEVINYAPAIAAMNRGIKAKNIARKAYDFAFANLAVDFKNKEQGESIFYSINFLLAYLDSQVAFGFISEKKSDEIMSYLSENYDIHYER